MPSLSIGIQSLADLAAGKPALQELQGLTIVESTAPMMVGILEGGTVGGQTALGFFIKDPDGKTVHMAQLTAALFEQLYHAYAGAQLRFEDERTRNN